MDTTDPEIEFNDSGICNHCIEFDKNTIQRWYPNKKGSEKLLRIIEKIKKERKNHEYDCIIGLSGGSDSSYLAYRIKEYGLKTLAIHVDAGWNSELAVQNIERILKYCEFDLVTHVVNWETMRRLHIAYLKSGVANQDVPQDQVFIACLYSFAAKNKIRYVLNGGNIATESVFPNYWLYDNKDSRNLKAIFRTFDGGKLKGYKTISFFNYYFYYPFIKRMKVLKLLNYIPYNKIEAMKELEVMTGWKAYDRKHGESIFTKFFQNYFLIERYGFDKRLPHLSSLILSGQITREEALQKLSEPLYLKNELREDLHYVCKKLEISTDEFFEYLRSPKKKETDYPSNHYRYLFIKKAQGIIENRFSIDMKKYA